MTRRGLTIGCAFIALLALLAPAGRAALPEGPRLAITGISLKASRAVLFTVGADGRQPQTVLGPSSHLEASNPLPLEAPAWSPDGRTLVFPGLVFAPGAGPRKAVQTRLFAVGAEGGRPRALPGTDDAGDPVFSPDGQTIAFSRERSEHHARHSRRANRAGRSLTSTSTWLTNIGGGAPRRITPWKNGLENVPSSFSPDGLTLALTRSVGHGRSDAVALRLDTGVETVLARNAEEPVYSPDGSRLALSRTIRPGVPGKRPKSADLVVVDSDGSGEVRLVSASQGIAAHPQWDPSGQRLAFAMIKSRQTVQGLLTEGDSIFEVNADGTCLKRVLGASGTLYAGATWQPGPGRQAPPLTC